MKKTPVNSNPKPYSSSPGRLGCPHLASPHATQSTAALDSYDDQTSPGAVLCTALHVCGWLFMKMVAQGAWFLWGEREGRLQI